MAHPRNPDNWCACGRHTPGSRSGLCKACYAVSKINETGKRPLSSAKQTHDRHRHQKVRNHAKKIARSLPKECFVCRYQLHVELCHVKPIFTFPKDATFAEINSLDNLVYLCPNHHWEMDAGLVTIATGAGR